MYDSLKKIRRQENFINAGLGYYEWFITEWYCVQISFMMKKHHCSFHKAKAMVDEIIRKNKGEA